MTSDLPPPPPPAPSRTIRMMGYDFTFIRQIAPAEPPPEFTDNLFLHSARLFLGYTASIGSHSAFRATAEALINFNSLVIGDRPIGPGEATRFNGKLEFTTRIWKPLSFRAAFTARYNNAPTLNTNLQFAPDNPDRYNQRLDTLTELGILLTLI